MPLRGGGKAAGSLLFQDEGVCLQLVGKSTHRSVILLATRLSVKLSDSSFIWGWCFLDSFYWERFYFFVFI